MIDWDAPFPEVLRAWMKARGLTAKATAHKLEVSDETLKGWLYRKSGGECIYPEAFKKLMKMAGG